MVTRCYPRSLARSPVSVERGWTPGRWARHPVSQGGDGRAATALLAPRCSLTVTDRYASKLQDAAGDSRTPTAGELDV